MATVAEGVPEPTMAERLAARDGLRRSLARWGAQARAAELVKLLVVPGAVAVVGGFVVMFIGWYGAARSYPDVAQIPYVISGGFVGLALVVLGGLLLASAVWTAQLGRMQRAFDQRVDQIEQRPAPAAASSRRGTGGQ